MMWNERYATEDYAYGKEPNDFLRRTADDIEPGPVLCLGEGEGRNAVWLAQLGFAVTAVDQSEVGLAKAQRLASERAVKIDTVQADLADYAIEPGHWSAVISIFCHLPETTRRDIHRRAVTGLRPGGTLILEAFQPEQAERTNGGPSDPALMPDLDQLRDDFTGLNLQLMDSFERPMQEGVYHSGDALVIQILGFKPGV